MRELVESAESAAADRAREEQRRYVEELERAKAAKAEVKEALENEKSRYWKVRRAVLWSHHDLVAISPDLPNLSSPRSSRSART